MDLGDSLKNKCTCTFLIAGTFASIRTNRLLFSQLLYLLAVLYFVDKNFGRLETGHKVFINYQGRVSGDVTSDFLFTLLIDETSKSTNVNVIATCHGTLHNAEKCFN